MEPEPGLSEQRVLSLLFDVSSAVWPSSLVRASSLVQVSSLVRAFSSVRSSSVQASSLVPLIWNCYHYHNRYHDHG